jgi:GT2 family glycosyltransferase
MERSEHYQSRPAVDAVVPAWNNWDLTRSCVEHLLASSVPVHVIVVDNGSSDGTAQKLREQFPTVTLVPLEENIGFGRAVNRGLEFAGGDIFAVVNNDANVAPDYFELVADCFSDPKVGFASGVAVNPGTGSVDGAGATIDRGLSWYPIGSGSKPADLVFEDSVVFSSNSEAISYRRSAFTDAGGFDEEFFAYGEDLDLALRLHAAGWETKVARGAHVAHVGSASLGTRSIAQMRLAAWGRGYVLGRYRPGAGWLALDFCIAAINCLLLRSRVPFTQLISGWRRGRKLDRREIPALEYEPLASALRKRFGLVS